MSVFVPPETCPCCGAVVPPQARACPQCGADEHTGWSEEALSSGLDLPGEEPFDYEEFTRREFGRGQGRRSVHWFWWLVAAGLLLLLGLRWLV